MDFQLESKLREMVDRHEIWQLMLRYSRGIDRFDRELVRSCYWDDAIDDHQTFVGTADQFLDDWVWPFHSSYQTLHHHCLSNHSCELTGDDAHAETYYTFFGSNREPPHMLSIGRYIDHLQRRDSEWRIANRVCAIEATYKLEDLTDFGSFETPGLPPPLHAGRDREDLSYMRPVRPRQPVGEGAK